MITTESIGLTEARQAIEAILAAVTPQDNSVSIAVADAHGDLIACLRQDGAAARMVRTNHGILVGAYVLFVLVAFIGPGTLGVVTPTIEVWVYALVAGVLHVAMLSIFAHRWRVLSPAITRTAPQEAQVAASAET